MIRTFVRKPEFGHAVFSILLFLVLGVWYSLIVPPFETPDEPFHFAFARHIAQGNWLPVQEPDAGQPWSHEGSQAPLYYILTGLLTTTIDQSDYEQINKRNPRANMGSPLTPGNKNYMLYSGADRPLKGSVLALHIGRWFSLLLGASTLWFTWKTARLAFPGFPSLQRAALLFGAVIPQFVFISASFSNDSAVTVAATVSVYLLALIVHRQTQNQHVSAWCWLVLGVLLALAALSKISGLGLYLLTAIAAWSIAIRTRDWLLPWRILPQILIPFLLIAGWWYWRNHTLYGDWLGSNLLLEINGLRTERATWLEQWNEFRGLRHSFWGLFGWFNLALPLWCYTIFDALTLLGLLGIFGHVLRLLAGRSLEGLNVPVLLLLGSWALIPLALIFYWAQNATSSQGRLLFPSLSALVILLVVGLHFWLNLLSAAGVGETVRRALTGLLAAFPLACALFGVAFIIPEAYYAPPPLEELPPGIRDAEITYGDADFGQTQFVLLGMDIARDRVYPGQDIPLTLYLRALEKPNADYQIFIQLLDQNDEQIANVTTHPGWGRNPTSLWEPQAIYADHYRLKVNEPIASESPLLARVYVGFIDPKTDKKARLPLLARNARGEAVTPIPAAVTLLPNSPPELTTRAPTTKLKQASVFGDVIALTGYAAPASLTTDDERFTVQSTWESLGAPSTDYVAYVHLLNREGERVAGYDQPPAGRRFPTRYWRPGDSILTEFEITLPRDLSRGTYQLWIGMYEEASHGGTRLPISAPGQLATQHNQLLLRQISIE